MPFNSKCGWSHASAHVDVQPSSTDLPRENESEKKTFKSASSILALTTATPMPLPLVSPLEKEIGSQRCVRTTKIAFLVPRKSSTISPVVGGESSPLTDLPSSSSLPSRDRKVGRKNEKKNPSRPISLQKTKTKSTSSHCCTKKSGGSSCHPSRDAPLPSSAHASRSRVSRQAALTHPRLSRSTGDHSSPLLSTSEKIHSRTQRSRKSTPIQGVEKEEERPTPSPPVPLDVRALTSVEKSCSSLGGRNDEITRLPLRSPLGVEKQEDVLSSLPSLTMAPPRLCFPSRGTDGACRRKKGTPPTQSEEGPCGRAEDSSPTLSSIFSSESFRENLFSPPPSLTLKANEEDGLNASLTETWSSKTLKTALVCTTERTAVQKDSHGESGACHRGGGKEKSKHSSSLSTPTQIDEKKGKKEGFPAPLSPLDASRGPPFHLKNGTLHTKRRTGGVFSWKAFAEAALAGGVSGILKYPAPSSPHDGRSSSTSTPKRKGKTKDFPTAVPCVAGSKVPSSADWITCDIMAPPPSPSPTQSVGSSSSSSLNSMSCFARRHVCLDPSFVVKDITQSTLEVLWKELEKKFQTLEILPTTPRGVVRLMFPVRSAVNGTAAVMMDSLPAFPFPADNPIDSTAAAHTVFQPPSEERRKQTPSGNRNDNAGKVCHAPWRQVEATSVGATAATRTTASIPSTTIRQRDRTVSRTSLPMPTPTPFIRAPLPCLPAIFFVKSVSLYEFHRALSCAIQKEGNGAADRYKTLAPWLVTPISTMMAYLQSTTSSHVGWKGQEKGSPTSPVWFVPHHNVGKVYDILTIVERTVEACENESSDRTTSKNSLTSTHLHYLEENKSNVFFCSELAAHSCLPPFAWKWSTCLPRGSFFLYVRGDENGQSLAPRVGAFSKTLFLPRNAECDLLCVAPVESAVSSPSQSAVHRSTSGPARQDGSQDGEDVARRNPTTSMPATYFSSLYPSARDPHCTPGGWTLHQLANLFWQTLCGLRHLHTKNRLYHGNLKPSNFVLSAEDGHLILTDIGLPFFPDAMVKAEFNTIVFSKWHRPSPFCSPDPSSRLTRDAHAKLEAEYSTKSTFPDCNGKGAREFVSECGEGKEGKNGERMPREGWWTYPPYLKIRNILFTPPKDSFPSCASEPSSQLLGGRDVTATPKEPGSVRRSMPCSATLESSSDSSSHILSSTSFLIEEFHFLRHFMAPECMLEVEGNMWVDYSAQSPASDAYAVGMLFYWLYHGAFPTTTPLFPDAVRYEDLPISLRERYPTPEGGVRNTTIRKGNAERKGPDCEIPLLYVVAPFSAIPTSPNACQKPRDVVSQEPDFDVCGTSMNMSRRRQVLQNDDGSLDYILRQLLQSNPQERLLLEDARLLKFFCLYGTQRHELLAIKNEKRECFKLSQGIC